MSHKGRCGLGAQGIAAHAKKCRVSLDGCSLNLGSVLNRVGKCLPYEVSVGRNRRIWVRAGTVKATLEVSQLLQKYVVARVQDFRLRHGVCVQEFEEPKV